ncbi:leucyl aminopeptidase [Rhizobium leguminosarum]|uniref:Probable cytosol aminopeptidase n=2 Tax=Rhizobium leguminosarum TaxID=384 RepID=AMPA_RHILW|nr:leucyl aminopeptidase [Rhizobium leguminosarum]B5ZWY7.1 RecName: Full=Probable cytosol aminopeptidase; AltName: Full=Leucine aminopeptidase; Short=LAP; AltName: Full=Leucyl aminopeptidase [Rhizobium leguminosarum bv. trifolii WSM2304]ACI54364.1 Leucyl aminopeptidase [Rhizobium leguminosarum bv. trifolii WSM2304]NYJ10089.1 leucyl aminopeptidase [Rhizobium leguminosarum]
MSAKFEISFSKSAKLTGGLAILLKTTDADSAAGAETVDPAGVIAKAARIARFSAKSMSALDIVAPEGASVERIVVIGLGKAADLTAHDWLKAGGTAAARIKNTDKTAVFIDVPGRETSARAAADFALGMLLRTYSFDTYKTKKNDDEEKAGKSVKVTIVTTDPAGAKKAFSDSEAIAGGVNLARDLVNEPPNVLGPVEFAAKAKELEKLGIEVEILTEKEMRRFGMGALLGVAQGSVRPPRLAVMQWKGGKAKDRPVAFIGKGVVFDTGGISIKPAAGMEDMKGDMGGAAAVTGLMHVLASRKAAVNAVGIIGLVENMPDGNAQRPGDIVTSMSGQTIEVINTDAEGRLVLCDALWYCNDRFKPQFMINLATLTGAIVVALGNVHAGLFSNDDQLSAQLTEAGLSTNEKLWRMPLGKDYDKLIDSKFADMKNTGGRQAGSITAAHFIKRFVQDTPWAHLDIAGTAMGSPQDEINQSWGSGFGVRLLDELVRAHYES